MLATRSKLEPLRTTFALADGWSWQIELAVEGCMDSVSSATGTRWRVASEVP